MQIKHRDSPLAGIKVIELAQMIAAPSAAQLLGDYGAEIIKIEPPSGDSCRHLRSPATRSLPTSPIFQGYNRGKTLITLDLACEEGRERALELIRGADVLLESSRRGAMDRLGLGADQLLELFPRLVYASVSGYGDGPLGSARGGVDMIVQAESGMMALTGYPDGPPTKIGFTVIDAACGHALCHGVMAALFRRSQIGLGGHVQVSLYDVAIHLQTGPLSEYLATGIQAPRTGNTSPLTSPASLFRCKEGELVVSAYLESQWQSLATLVGAPELTSDERFNTASGRVANRAELLDLLARHFALRSAREWVELFREHGLLAGEVKTYGQVLEDPILAESGMIMRDKAEFGIANPVRVSLAKNNDDASGGAFRNSSRRV